jgi:hypothetical protein
VSGWPHAPAALLLGKESQYVLLLEDWVGPTAGLDVTETDLNKYGGCVHNVIHLTFRSGHILTSFN